MQLSHTVSPVPPLAKRPAPSVADTLSSRSDRDGITSADGAPAKSPAALKRSVTAANLQQLPPSKRAGLVASLKGTIEATSAHWAQLQLGQRL